MLLAGDEWAVESQGDGAPPHPNSLPQEYSPSGQPRDPGVQSSLKQGIWGSSWWSVSVERAEGHVSLFG